MSYIKQIIAAQSVPFEDAEARPFLYENLQEACFVPTELSEHLRKPPGVYGGM